jgi:hypothetical protein
MRKKTMSLRWYQLLVLPVALVSTVSFGVQGSTSLESNVVAEVAAGSDSGEEETIAAEATGTTSSVVAAPTTNEAGITGSVEVAPTAYIGTNDGLKTNYGVENTIEAGYKFNKDLTLLGHTEINNNLDNRGRTANVWFGDTIIRMPWNNIWNNQEIGLSFSWEPRVYLPTADDQFGKGYIGAVRNYLKLKKSIVANVFDLTLMDIPVVYGYDNDGVGGKPNSAFENRVYLVADFSMFNNKVAFSLPFLYYYGFNRTIAGLPTTGTANGGQYHIFYIWPELTYSVTANFDIGVRYQTGDFLTDNYATSSAKLDIGKGFENGMAQVVFRAQL